MAPSSRPDGCPARSDPDSPPAPIATALSVRTLAAGLALAMALALSGTTGCMVMDELDSAAAKMPTSNQKKKEAKAAPTGKGMTPTERLAAAKSAVSERSKQWWKEAKTMTPGEKPAGIVRCRLAGDVLFMSKDDCSAQGGSPVDGSG